MSYSKREFARGLRRQLEFGYDVKRISDWAYEQHLGAERLEPGLEAEMLKVIAMQEGVEFEMSEEELYELICAMEG